MGVKRLLGIGYLMLDHPYRFRKVKDEWKIVRWFPQVIVEILDAGSDWVHAVRHDGKEFTAPDSKSAIQDALDDWAKTR